MNGYNYTYLVEFTSIPADYIYTYLTTHPPALAAVLPTTWAMVALPTCHVISGPTHTTITQTKEAPPTHHVGYGGSTHPVMCIC